MHERYETSTAEVEFKYSTIYQQKKRGHARCMNEDVYENILLFLIYYVIEALVVSLGVSPIPYALPPTFSNLQVSSLSPSFHRSHKTVEGGRNYMKIPLFSSPPSTCGYAYGYEY